MTSSVTDPEVIEARTKNEHVYLELSERTPDGGVLSTGESSAPGNKLLVRAKPVFKAQ